MSEIKEQKEYIVRWKKCYSMIVEAKDRDEAIEKATIRLGEDGECHYFDDDTPMDAEIN